MRELENVLERALTLSTGGEITAEHVRLRSAARPPVPEPAAAAAPATVAAGTALESHLESIERDAIIKALEKTGTEILAPPAVVQTVTTGKAIANGETRNWQDWTIQAIPAYNLKRGPAPGKLFHDKGRGNGYVLTYGGKRFYFSCDTENVPEMRALKDIDVAFVCMNLPYTMPPEEAAEAVKAFHPKIVIPYHYRGSDLRTFEKGLEGTGIEVRLLNWYPQ